MLEVIIAYILLFMHFLLVLSLVMLNKTIIVILINKRNCTHVLVFELILNRITFQSVTDFLKYDYNQLIKMLYILLLLFFLHHDFKLLHLNNHHNLFNFNNFWLRTPFYVHLRKRSGTQWLNASKYVKSVIMFLKLPNLFLCFNSLDRWLFLIISFPCLPQENLLLLIVSAG